MFFLGKQKQKQKNPKQMKLPSCSMKSQNLSPCIPAVMNSSQVHTTLRKPGSTKKLNVLLELEAKSAPSWRSIWPVVSKVPVFCPKVQVLKKVKK